MRALMDGRQEFLQWLKRKRLAYTTTETSSSFAVIYKGGKVFFCDGARWQGRQFQLLKALRERAALVVAAGLVAPTPPRVEYFALDRRKFKAERGREIALEIDLRAAYPTAAYRLGILNRDLYARLKAEPKEHRTKLLGSLAVRRDISRFDTLGRRIDRKTEYDPAGVATWRTICAAVGNDLLDCSRADAGFLAFWVDNYWTTTTTKTTTKLAEKYELKSHVDEITWRRIEHSFLILNAARGRQFTLPLHARFNDDARRQRKSN